MTAEFIQHLIDKASAPYRCAGRFAWHFARGKLGGDPVFVGLLERGLIADRSRILDIGCGQGLLASWLLAAQALHRQQRWPLHWPAAPQVSAIHGIELMPRDVERAQQALQGSDQCAVRFTVGDMCRAEFGQADAAVILDVLHYVNIDAQNDVLRRVRDALLPAGILILRVGDAAGGWRFRYSVLVDRVATFARGHRNSRLYCRTLPEWQATLDALGFAVERMPMNQGTPFANVLLVAKLGQGRTD